jgi:hypothetical protein
VRRVRPVLLAVLLVLGLGLTGCVSLPRSGSVSSVAVTRTGDGDALVDYTPPGPTPGSAPVPLVQNFLDAMTATPLTTSVARQFLTTATSRTWDPEKGTISYGGVQLDRGPGGRVDLRLSDVTELDARGTWLGDPTGGRGHDVRLRLVKERGQWRINRPPDRLLVPRTHFETHYQQLLLYYFDRSAQVLVPEPVFLPRGRQAATLLVTDLLRGPEPYLADVEQTYFPRGAALDGLSVPVSRDGTAEVPLGDDVLDLPSSQRTRLLAQLAWTLGQIPGVARLRVTVDGTPLDLPGSREDLSVEDSSQFDPSVVYASADTFGLRGGRVVTVDEHGEQRISGPAGGLDLGLRSLAVDLLAQRVAGVTRDGRTVLESDRDGVPGRAPARSDVRTVLTGGTDLARPVYDRTGQLWVLDRTRSGARVSVVRTSGTGSSAATVRAPGITGADVERLLVSRDGTRLVALVRRGARAVVLLARVVRDDRGRVQRVVGTRRLPVDGSGAIRDLSWRTPSSVAVLRTQQGRSSLVVAEVDGSSGAAASTGTDVFERVADRVVSSPSRRSPLLLATSDGRYHELSVSGTWRTFDLRPGLRALTFVG